MTTPKRAPGRPLSPHLGVWRWPVTMASSIFHRASGVGNAIGLVLLAWWLIAVASGPEAYANFAGLISQPLGRVALFGFTASLCYHLLNGIRHLVWDAGKGFGLPIAFAWSWFNIFGAIALAVGVWFAGYAMMGVA